MLVFFCDLKMVDTPTPSPLDSHIVINEKLSNEVNNVSEKKTRFNKPIQEQAFGDILHSMDSFFHQAISHIQGPRLIPIYQYETAKYDVIEAELPGVKKDQITLDVFQNNLKISVESKEVLQQDEKKLSYKQSSRFQHSERVVSLPYSINESDLKATLSQGVLTIKISNNRKRIPIDSKEV